MNNVKGLLFLIFSVSCVCGMEKSGKLSDEQKAACYVGEAAFAAAGGALIFGFNGRLIHVTARLLSMIDNLHVPYVRFGAAAGLASFVYGNHKFSRQLNKKICETGKCVYQLTREQLTKKCDWARVGAAAGKRAYAFTRESGEVVGKHACKFAREQLAKERDWQTTLDPLLEANNTF